MISADYSDHQHISEMLSPLAVSLQMGNFKYLILYILHARNNIQVNLFSTTAITWK
jgi:hypothetical protein